MARKWIVIDANILADIFKGKHPVPLDLSDDPGPLEILLEEITKVNGIAYDRFILHEWEEVCGKQWVSYWITNLIPQGKVQEIEVSEERQLKTIRDDLRKNFHLPMDSMDYRYIACAAEYPPRYVLSRDIDMYDPTDKGQPSKTQKRIRYNKSGALCQHVQDAYGVTIGCFCHVIADLDLPTTPPASYPDCHP